MGQAIFANQINNKYLMNKSKSDIVSLTLWIIGNQERDRNEFSELLTKIVQCLDDKNIEGAQELIKAWDRWHKPWEIEP